MTKPTVPTTAQLRLILGNDVRTAQENIMCHFVACGQYCKVTEETDRLTFSLYRHDGDAISARGLQWALEKLRAAVNAALAANSAVEMTFLADGVAQTTEEHDVLTALVTSTSFHEIDSTIDQTFASDTWKTFQVSMLTRQ